MSLACVSRVVVVIPNMFGVLRWGLANGGLFGEGGKRKEALTGRAEVVESWI